MKRANLIVAISVVLLLSGAGAVIAYLARENFNLKVELGTLRYKLEAVSKASPAQPPPVVPAETGGRTVGELTRQVMMDGLAAETGTEKKLWLRVDPRDREAAGFARQIAEVFRAAGWEAVVLDNQGLRFKPGLLMLIGVEESPPSYVQAAQRALEALPDPVTVGTGYVSFYEKKKKESADWKGIAFMPGQTYVVWVGRKPEPAATP